MRCKIKFFFWLNVFLTSFIHYSAYALNEQIDSLSQELKKHTIEDTVRVNLLNQLANASTEVSLLEVRKYASEANYLSDKLNYSLGKAYSLYLLSESYRTDDIDIANNYAKRAKNIFLNLNEPNILSQVYKILSLIHYKKGEYQEAFEDMEKALSLAKAQKNDRNYAKYLCNRFLYYQAIGEYENAIKDITTARDIAEKNDYKDILITTFINFASISHKQGNVPKALEYYLASLRLAEEIQNNKGLIYNYMNIGAIYYTQEEFEKSKVYYEKGLALAKVLKNYSIIANSIHSLGRIELKLNNYQKALSYYKETLQICEENKMLRIKMFTLISLGEYYFMCDNIEQSITFYNQAYTISKKLSLPKYIAEIQIEIAKLDILQKKYEKAAILLTESLKTADKLKIIQLKKNAHAQFSALYAATQQYEQAYQHQLKFKLYNDSIYNFENTKKQVELEYKYTIEKEKQVLLLRQEKEQSIQTSQKKIDSIIINSLTVGVLFLLVFIIYIFRSLQLHKDKNQVLNHQKVEIETLNHEYKSINEELSTTNKQLHDNSLLLEKSEERLRLLISSSYDVFLLTNKERKHTFVSEALLKSTNFTSDEILTNPIDHYIHPDDRELFWSYWQNVIDKASETEAIQFRHLHKDGHYLWFEAIAQNLLENPSINAIITNIRDITQRKQFEEKLKAIEEEQKSLIEQELISASLELEKNNFSMAASTLKLIQTAEHNEKMIDQLVSLEKMVQTEGKAIINSLILDYKRMSNQNNWEEFELLFQKTHNSFYEKLNRKYPSLTANERKLCAFLKLNMSNKDIAQITFQSEVALKKARMRLRKKLDLERSINLQSYIQQIDQLEE